MSKSTDIQHYDPNELLKDDEINRLAKKKKQVDLQEYQSILNKDPRETSGLYQYIKLNPYADNTPYLPIRVVEMLLDRMYFGLWKTHSLKQWRELNSICATITLEVFHPIQEIWISRSGSGAVPVQLQKDAEVHEFEKINKMALQKNVPSAKSFAMTNAARSLGRIFGRDLAAQEDEVMEFQGLISEKKAKQMKGKSLSQIIKETRNEEAQNGGSSSEDS